MDEPGAAAGTEERRGGGKIIDGKIRRNCKFKIGNFKGKIFTQAAKTLTDSSTDKHG